MLTDSQREQQPLLENFGIIMMPPGINDEAYHSLSWALKIGRLLHPEMPLELRCVGHGGDSAIAFALIDLIIADGNIDGVVLGECVSSHSVIWAACNRRFVYPNSAIGIHQIYNASGAWEALGEGSHYLEASRLNQVNAQVASVYAAASNKPKKWWLNKIMSAHVSAIYLTSAQLISLTMASPISSRETIEPVSIVVSIEDQDS